ncbi:hypothetical protein J6590_085705 [Homalodisca vitripennis]|nr:hypothetical protein J6590_085705 [Homalodisca vitripennis]
MKIDSKNYLARQITGRNRHKKEKRKKHFFIEAKLGPYGPFLNLTADQSIASDQSEGSTPVVVTQQEPDGLGGRIMTSSVKNSPRQ